VTVELGFKYWTFDCDELGFSCPKRCTYEMELAGTYRYTILVKTDDKEEAGTDAPIYVDLVGTQGRTPVKILSEKGFEKSTSTTKVISGKDLGDVYGIVLSETVNDPWTPKFIKVTYKGKFEEFEFHGQ